MPSQKLCEPTSTERGSARNCCISARLGASPCCSTRIPTPSASNSARSFSAIACSARSVVVSTKLRPPSTRAKRAASVATAAGCPASLGLGMPAGT